MIAQAPQPMLLRRCRWRRDRCKTTTADECQWHAAPLLDLAPAELIRQWKSVQRLIPELIGLMRSLLLRRLNPLSAISPHALSVTGLVSRVANANKLVIRSVKSSYTGIV